MRTADLLGVLDKFVKKYQFGNLNISIVERNKPHEYKKISKIKLEENKLIGQPESHRIIIVVE